MHHRPSLHLVLAFLTLAPGLAIASTLDAYAQTHPEAAEKEEILPGPTPLRSARGNLDLPFPFAYSIANWKDNKTAAYSITIDDNTGDQFLIGLPAFEARGYRVTFYVTTDWVVDSNQGHEDGSWADLRQAWESGHEIANHSVTHSYFSELSRDQIRWEVAESNRQLKTHLPGLEIISHAYPYGDGDTAFQTVARFFRSARDHIWPGEAPADFVNYKPDLATGSFKRYKLKSFVPHEYCIADRAACLAETLNHGGWFIEMYHQFGPDAEPPFGVKLDLLNRFLDEIEAVEDRLWIAPVGEIIAYLDARETSSLVATACDDHTLTLKLCSAMEADSSFLQPLTIHLTVPGEWTDCLVRQHNEEQQLSPEGGVLTFNAQPDLSDIAITWK